MITDSQNVLILSGSLPGRSLYSTPDDTSTTSGLNTPAISLTFSGLRPPARKTVLLVFGIEMDVLSFL